MAKANKKGGFKINMKDVGEGFTPLEEGRHEFTVSECELTESSNGNPMLKFVYTVDGTSSKLYENCVLTPQSLWNLANVFRCLGLTIPKEETEYRPGDFIGLQGVCETMNEKNQDGKTFPRIIQYIPATTNDDEDIEDDEEISLEEYLEDLEDEEVIELAKSLGIKVTKKSSVDGLKEKIADMNEKEVWEKIEELFPEDDEDDDDESESEDGESDDEDDIDIEETLSELETEDLKLIANDLGINVKKLKTDEAIIEKIMKEDEDDIIQSLKDADLLDGESEDDDDEDDDDYDYEEMDLEDLKELCNDRGIKVTKKDKKKDLIKKLEEDDEDGDDD